MINTIWKDNELYNLLLSNIDDIEKAQEMFNCILPYLLDKYGKDKITINSLLIVMPEDLYDCMKTANKLYYMDLVSIICMYKLQTNCDIGFTMKRYEDAYNKKLQFEKILEQKQQIQEQRKQLAKERKLDINKINDWANAQVFLAVDALNLKLIDELGSYEYAKKELEKMSKVKNPVWEKEDKLDKFLDKLSISSSSFISKIISNALKGINLNTF